MGSGDIDLADAYAVETPDDNRGLYARWADTYESGFITDNAYCYHLGVARAFLDAGNADDGPLLDVGCGTGLVGEALRSDRRCPLMVHGLDLSPEMLDRASTKRTVDDAPVYDNLLEGDLTAVLSVDDGSYGGVTSCGTFTHGHVGPAAFDELYRIVRPGALFAIGINPEHFVASGFEARFASDVIAKVITEPIVHQVPTYGAGPHINQMSPVVVFRRR